MSFLSAGRHFAQSDNRQIEKDDNPALPARRLCPRLSFCRRRQALSVLDLKYGIYPQKARHKPPNPKRPPTTIFEGRRAKTAGLNIILTARNPAGFFSESLFCLPPSAPSADASPQAPDSASPSPPSPEWDWSPTKAFPCSN